MKYPAIAAIFIIFISLIPAVAVRSGSETAVDHSVHVGEKIHESTVQDYQLAYHLLDLPNKGEHHLMVYVIDPQEKAVTKAKIGYLVVSPDGKKQKAMAMAMKASFGADIDFSAKGTYTIKTKVVADGEKLLDSFTYEVK